MTAQNVDLFDAPIKSKEIRKGIWAHQYRTGIINIMGEKYQGYSMTDAVRLWRSKGKAKKSNFHNQ